MSIDVSAVPSSTEATTDVSASTRAVPGDLAGLLAQHGVDPGQDSHVRTAPRAGAQILGRALILFGPVSAAVAAALLGSHHMALWIVAAIAGLSSCVTLALLLRRDPAVSAMVLAGALAIGLAASFIPVVSARHGHEAQLVCACAGAALVVVVLALLTRPGRLARGIVHAAIAGIPAYATVLYRIATVY